MYTLCVDNPDKLYFTSDNHHSHFNICKYCNRPFTSRSEMDQTLIKNWNSVVPEDGIVICCGDFMLPHKNNFNEYLKYVKQLNGIIYLTSGNHDRIDIGEYCLDGEIVPKLIVNDMMMIKCGDIKIFAQHYPCIAFNGDYQVFGHVHTLFDGTVNGVDNDVVWKARWNQYDVGVDQNGYKPVSYKQLMEIFEKRKKYDYKGK